MITSENKVFEAQIKNFSLLWKIHALVLEIINFLYLNHSIKHQNRCIMMNIRTRASALFLINLWMPGLYWRTKCTPLNRPENSIFDSVFKQYFHLIKFKKSTVKASKTNTRSATYSFHLQKAKFLFCFVASS